MRIDNTFTPGDGQPNFGKPFNKFLPVGPPAPPSTDAYLLESGDFYLLESGDKYLLE